MLRRRFLQAVAAAVLTACVLVPPAAMAQGPIERVEVIVGFHQPPGLEQVQMIENLGGQVSRAFWIVPAMTITIPEPAINALLRDPRVRYVEPNGEVWAHGQTVPWGIDRVFGDESYPFDTWNITRGDGVAVAILDTGIDEDHEDLPPLLGGVNKIDNTHWGSDGSGHGTHVAGTVAALDNNLGVVGVGPQIGLYAVKVLSDGGGGTVESVVSGIQWAVQKGIPILNMSLGTRDHYQTLKDACDAAYAAGCLVVASAGNEGNPPGRGDNVGYPAAYDSVIAVAASASNDRRASYSSTGPAVELIAPGSSILSTLPGNSYGTYSGTSMAAPHVAGAAALVWAANSNLSNAGVRDILQETAEDLGLDWNHQGFGLVRADLAVAAVADITPPDPALFVTVTTDKDYYVSGTDTIATVAVLVTDENGDPINGLESTAFAAMLDGKPIDGATFTEFEDTGVYTWDLAISEFDNGEYTVGVTVTVGDLIDSDSYTFTIGPAPTEATIVSVTGITYATSGGRNNDRHLHVTAAVADDLGDAVAGASVSIELLNNESLYGSAAGTTGSNGTVTFSFNNAPSGTYTTTVTSVIASGLTWDGKTPENGTEK